MLNEKSELKNKKILIVDDDLISLTILEKMLSHAGYDVIKATNGKEALLRAKERQPDLAVLDIAMPELDGINVATILKSDPQTKNVPIIFLSALVGEEIRKEISSVPGSSFLIKPFRKDDLLREIKQFL